MAVKKVAKEITQKEIEERSCLYCINKDSKNFKQLSICERCFMELSKKPFYKFNKDYQLTAGKENYKMVDYETMKL